MVSNRFIADSMTNEWHIDEYKKYLNETINQRLETVGTLVEAETVNNIAGNNDPELLAVDTGNLMNSITHTIPERINDNEMVVRIGTDVEYAPFVFLGTYKMKARPSLQRAVLENSDKIMKAFGGEFTSEMNIMTTKDYYSKMRFGNRLKNYSHKGLNIIPHDSVSRFFHFVFKKRK